MLVRDKPELQTARERVYMTTGTIIIIHFEFNQKVFCLLVFPLLKCFRVADFFFQLIPKEEWKNNQVGMLSEDAPNLQNIIACVVYSCSAVLYLAMMCVKLIIDVLSLVFSTCFFSKLQRGWPVNCGNLI